MRKKERLSKLLRIICITFIANALLTGSNANSKDVTLKRDDIYGREKYISQILSETGGISDNKIDNVIDTDTTRATAVTGTSDLAAIRKKFEMLKKSVSDAKSRGVNTSYEDITITTAGLFLYTYIPWDISHPSELASAYSRWSKKQDLKGTPQQEAIRTPEWELKQTSDILDDALTNLAAVRQRPESRRPVPKVNVDHLKVADGFLSSDGQPVFSGGFIWAPVDIDKSYSGLIGGEVWLPFGTLQSNGTLSEKTIADVINKLNLLQSKGQKGSIGFGQTIPSWAVSQWPDIDDYAGHFFSYDIDHPQVRELWKNFIASLVPKIKNHPAKFDYQLAIEPIWPSIGNWMVKNASPYTYQKYRLWLGELYGTVGALNTSWGTGYSNFSEINSRPPDNSNPAIWYDWCRFNQWRVTGFFKFISDEIHKYDPDALCHIRISVGGINEGRSGTSTYTGQHNGIDREALVKMFEINGLDNFMEAASGRTSRQHDRYDNNAYSLRWLGHTILLDFIRSLGPDKLIYDSEWHSVSSVYYINPEPPAGYMHTALWLSALHGLGATRTWYWSRNADGSFGRSQEESYGSLLVQPRLLNEYGIGLAELNTFSKEVVALERAPKQIFLLYSEPSAVQSIDYLNTQMITYEALHSTGLPIGFVTENGLRELGLPPTCKWLIIAGASHISQNTLDWLRTYVKGGGKLLVIGNDALKYNEYGKINNPSQLEFVSGADKLEVAALPILFGRILELMSKTLVNRPLQCIESNDGNRQPAFGVMCRSVEYHGGHLVCLINVAAVPKDISLELNGRSVAKALNLFENKMEKIRTIQLKPLEVRLFQVSK